MEKYIPFSLMGKSYSWELSDDGTYYTAKDILYCTKPVEVRYDEEHLYQGLIVSVPAAYLNPDGSINKTAAVNGYTAETAPIILKNNCQGWNSSVPTFERDDCVVRNYDYVREGFVYVGVGARSRNIKEGKAPAPVVDIKAGIRFLRCISGQIPGDTERIVSFGGSGAGEMSSVIGASGNMEDYFPYLYDIGAMGIELRDGKYISTISDAVYGCMVFYPIADMENADMAYCWIRLDSGGTELRNWRTGETKKFTPFQLALQDDLAAAYCDYLNSLQLRDEDGNLLTLDGLRSGNYHQKILDNLSFALKQFLSEKENPDEYILQKYGKDGALPNWLKKEADGSYTVTELAGFFLGTGLVRGKGITGFDSLEKTSENNAFGRIDEDAVHFSPSLAKLLSDNYDRYSALSGFDKKNADECIAEASRSDIAKQVYLMNAADILLKRAKGLVKTDISPLWRVRKGTADQHASFTVSYNIALAAMMNGAEVDYSLVWDMIHGKEIEGTSTGTFINWVKEICPADK